MVREESTFKNRSPPPSARDASRHSVMASGVSTTISFGAPSLTTFPDRPVSFGVFGVECATVIGVRTKTLVSVAPRESHPVAPSRWTSSSKICYSPGFVVYGDVILTASAQRTPHTRYLQAFVRSGLIRRSHRWVLLCGLGSDASAIPNSTEPLAPAIYVSALLCRPSSDDQEAHLVWAVTQSVQPIANICCFFLSRSIGPAV